MAPWAGSRHGDHARTRPRSHPAARLAGARRWKSTKCRCTARVLGSNAPCEATRTRGWGLEGVMQQFATGSRRGGVTGVATDTNARWRASTHGFMLQMRRVGRGGRRNRLNRGAERPLGDALSARRAGRTILLTHGSDKARMTRPTTSTRSISAGCTCSVRFGTSVEISTEPLTSRIARTNENRVPRRTT